MASDRTFSARRVWRDTLEKALPVTITVLHGTDLVFSLRMPGTKPVISDWTAHLRSGRKPSKGGVISTRFPVSSEDLTSSAGVRQ